MERESEGSAMEAIAGAAATLAQTAASAAAGAAGAGLGLGFGVTALLRRDKPLHPVGVVAPARLVVTPPPAVSESSQSGSSRSGSPFLDEPAEYSCVVRASYSVGTGPERADIEGLALRVLGRGPHEVVADILFASTGVGRVGRHVLVLRRGGEHGVMTTLLPVRSAFGPLYLRMDPVDALSRPWPSDYRLSWALGVGPWRPGGTLAVSWGEPIDAPERFDPIEFPMPGTTQYPLITAVREPAYRISRLAWPRAGRLPAG